MIEWLRTLSPPLRYSVYVGGVLLVWFIAVGVGAAAGVVFSWQLGRAAIGTADTGTTGTTTLEGSESGTAGTVIASEDTAIEPSGDFKNSNDATYKATFVHRATDENSRGDYTFISDPSINGDANAVVLVSPTSDRKSGEGASYDHNIGVWYAPAARRWAIFHQNRAAVPAGAAFKVVVPQASAAFAHRAEPSDTVGNATYLYGPATNGKPHAAVSVTQNGNPGGGEGVYNDHPVGVFYDNDVEQWAIYNRDGAPMPEGAAFNVAVSAGAN
jgi:hypothetical protein